MPADTRATDPIALMKGLRQSRRFLDRPVPPEIVADLLEVARWTGSAKNVQPWEFIVVTDRATNTALAEAGQFTRFLDNVACSIVIVLANKAPRAEAYDEGRLSERLMLAASHHGLGSGTAWFSTEEAQARVRAILGIPDDRVAWSAVGVGYVNHDAPQRSSSLVAGRKPLAGLTSYGHYGQRDPNGA